MAGDGTESYATDDGKVIGAVFSMMNGFVGGAGFGRVGAMGAVGLALGIAGGGAWAQPGTTDMADKAMTAFAANMRSAQSLSFEVVMSARGVEKQKLVALKTVTYQVVAQRPNRVEFVPVSGTKIRLESNGDQIKIFEPGGKTYAELAAPGTFDGFRRLIPRDLPPAEQSTFATVFGLLSGDPSGFLVGEALDRTRYATMRLGGQAGEVFQFIADDTKTLVGLTANARPQIMTLTQEVNAGKPGEIVLNYSFLNWNLRNRKPAPGQEGKDGGNDGDGGEEKLRIEGLDGPGKAGGAGAKAGSGSGKGETGGASDGGGAKPKKATGITIEDAPSKPR